MKLSDLKTGEYGIIVKLHGRGSFQKRLAEMGFVYGKRVKVVLNAPLQDPIEYEIIGYKISLRREEADRIEVVGEAEARNLAHVETVELSRDASDCDDARRVDEEMERLAQLRNRVIRVALVGNPNCGKTSLFNIAAGAHEHVGNYSGVTVDAKEGHFEYGGYRFTLVDLPGTYSLSAFSPEELYVRKSLTEEMPDVVVNVVDGSNLERNLYLTTQLIDMDLRVVMALNMYDEFRKRGDQLDTERLGQLLGMPLVPTVSRTGEGINSLFDTLIHVYERQQPPLCRHIHINHGAELEQSIARIQQLIKRDGGIRYKYSTRFLAIKYLERDKDVEGIVEALPAREEIIATRFEEKKRVEALMHTACDSAIVDAKYAFIQGALKETYVPGTAEAAGKRTPTDRIDAVVTNKWLAFPLFFFLLYVIFQGTFTLGNYPMEWIEWLVSEFGNWISTYMADGMLKDLIVDGIIGGVGSVLVFLPNIVILYLFISLLEDSGYMARAAFIMDKVMHRIGLHGKSFIPMIMGFGCNVPAIMATRTIESRRSRLITMLVIPFMSCTGRMPLYILLAGAFFPRSASLVVLGLYVLGIVVAVLSAHLVGRFVREEDLPFVMELPPYRVPTAKSVFRHTWEKGKQYLHKMGGIILVCSVIIWFLGYFPNHDSYSTATEQQENSYIGHIGKAIEPVFAPLGFDWKMSTGILSGVGAKELVVSTLGVMYSVGEVEDEGDMAAGDTALQRALLHTLTPAAALSYMVFVLLYFPCIATFAAIRQESGGWRWAVFSAVYTVCAAWMVAFAVYRLALLWL